MARFVKGDVVAGMFPFSNATGQKPRPALVLSSWAYTSKYAVGQAYLLCAISASTWVGADPFTSELLPGDIISGSLNKQSFLCPSYLFSADEKIITKKIGTLRAETFNSVLEKMRTHILVNT